jgi:hypothetical protein
VLLWNYISVLMEKACKETLMIFFIPPFEHLLGGNEKAMKNIKVNVFRLGHECRTSPIQNKNA